jgi:hypothetical protein
MVNFEYLFRILAENSELSGVWGKELFESDEKKKKDERSERVFLPPMLFGNYLTKNESIRSYAKLILLAPKVSRMVSGKLDSWPRRREYPLRVNDKTTENENCYQTRRSRK